MNKQCKDCIHINVCAYKEHYDDVANMYKAIREESSKYPWLLELTCVQYLQKEILKEDPDLFAK